MIGRDFLETKSLQLPLKTWKGSLSLKMWPFLRHPQSEKTSPCYKTHVLWNEQSLRKQLWAQPGSSERTAASSNTPGPQGCPWSPRTTVAWAKRRQGVARGRASPDEAQTNCTRFWSCRNIPKGKCLGFFILPSLLCKNFLTIKCFVFIFFFKLSAFLGWCKPNTSQQIVLAGENQKAPQKQTATAV